MNFFLFFVLFHTGSSMTINRTRRDLIGYNRLLNNVILNGGLYQDSRQHRRGLLHVEDIYQQIFNSHTINPSTRLYFEKFLKTQTEH